MKKRISLLLVAMLLLSLSVGGMAEVSKSVTATAQGFGGSVTVTVTVDGDKITQVVAEETSETAGIGSNAIEQLPGEMVAQNTWDVDDVAGATVSSKAVKDAAKAALDEIAGVVAQAAAMKPGTYAQTVTGHNAPITIQVTIGEAGTIDTIDVMDQKESRELGTYAMEATAQDIIARQSLDNDAISGATVSGKALTHAVRLAVEAAGGDANALMIPAEMPPAQEDTTCDMIVIGAGASGLGATLKASELGVHVILVEQLGFLGGSSIRTGYLSAGGTKLHAENGIEFSQDDYVATVQKSNSSYPHYDADFSELMARTATEIVDWAQELGAEFGPISAGNFRGPNSARMGSYFYTAVKAKLGELQTDVRLYTRATQILMEDGVAKGVLVEDQYGREYTIHSDNILIATGGYIANNDFVKEYAPKFDGYPFDVSIGADGSGMSMAVAVGGTLANMDLVSLHGFSTPYNGTSRSMQSAMTAGAVVVNNSGKRFINEKDTYTLCANAVLDQDGGYAYAVMDKTVFDSKNRVSDVGLSGIDEMYTVCADADALADVIGCDVSALKDTFDTYHGYIKAGEDGAFGKNADWLVGDYTEGPYSVVRVTPELHGISGGIVIDLTNMHVLDAAGIDIPGLYAAGECTNATTGHTQCISMGVLVAREVAIN